MNFSNINSSVNNLTFIQKNEKLSPNEHTVAQHLINKLNKNPCIKWINFKELLDKFESVQFSKTFRRSIIIAAAEAGNNEILLTIIGCNGKKLLNRGNHSYNTPLFLAAKNKHYSTTLHLLALGAEINPIIPLDAKIASIEGILAVKDSISLSTQMNEGRLSSKFSRSALTMAAAVDDNIKIVALLLRHGAQTHWFKPGIGKINENIQKAHQLIAKEDENFRLLLNGRVDANSFLNQVPSEIFFSIVNCMLWS